MEFGDVFDPLSYHLNNRLKNRDGFHVIVFAFSPVKKLCLFCKGRGEKSKQSKTNLKNTNKKKVPNGKLSLHLRISASSCMTKFMQTAKFLVSNEEKCIVYNV